MAGSTVSYGYDAVFANARLEPFTDQANNALVADAVFQDLRTFSTDASSSSTVAVADLHVVVSDSTGRDRAEAVATALRGQGLDATSTKSTTC